MKQTFVPMIRCGIWVVVTSACLLSIAQAQQTPGTIRRNIAALTDEASTIVHGKVISASVEPDPNFANLTTVLVTLNVQDVLKGNADKTFTFRQFVWDFRERTNSAGYVKGQEMLLFLRAPSRYGLTSPAGLQQGRFLVRRDPGGKGIAINGIGNLGLFDNLGQGAKARGVALPGANAKINSTPRNGVDLNNLKQIVRAFAGGGR
jgi:hypothetical protein